MTTDWPWLRAEIDRAASGIATTLRRVDASTPVPGLDWTAGHLGAHVASFPDFYRHLATQPEPLPIPTDFDAFALEMMDARLGRSTEQLADDIESGFADWTDELGDDGAASLMSWVRHDVAGVGGAALNELLIHRRDLTPLTGETVEVSPDQARAILDGLLPMSAAFVDPTVARRCVGTFHVHLRGGTDWTIRVADATAVVTAGRPDRADVRTSVEPVSMLLTSLGREPQWKAAITGKAIAWGRKPWLALRFAQLFNSP